MNPKYQTMPELSDDEYQALKDDIEANGVLVPVEYDGEGNILDGYHRVRACAELGIKTWPRLIREDLSEDEKIAHAWRLNLARRHLNQEQKRILICDQLKAAPKKSDRQIAKMLGVHHTTVGTVRKELENTGMVANLATVVGADGVEQPRERKTVTASVQSSPQEEKTVTVSIKSNPPEDQGDTRKNNVVAVPKDQFEIFEAARKSHQKRQGKELEQHEQSDIMNDIKLLDPQLCHECKVYVIDTLNSGQRLDVHYCKHNQTFSQFRFKDGRLADTMLNGPITEAEVVALLADAQQTINLQAQQRAKPGDTIN